MFPTSEEDLDYNGPLSYSGEIHMAIIGVGVGLVLLGSKTLRKEIMKEPQYLIGSAIITYLIGEYIYGDG